MQECINLCLEVTLYGYVCVRKSMSATESGYVGFEKVGTVGVEA